MDLAVSIKNINPLRGNIAKSASGGSGTDNYNDLRNKPSINGVPLVGNKTSADLQLSGALSEDLKQALLQLAQQVAYVDANGQTYYDDLYNALYPPVGLVYISAVFEQGQTVVYDDATLDSLKSMLTVTAFYDDNSSSTVPSTDYTLSGTLTAGTSTITVSYGGKTATFTVTVTAKPNYVSGMALWLDAREYSELASYKSITDQSGNNVPLGFGNVVENYVVKRDTFISEQTRGQIKASDSAFLAKLANGWSIEAVFQNRYYTEGDTSRPTDGGTGSRIASFKDGNGIILSNGQMQIPGSGTNLGTAQDLTTAVHTVSVVYDGTNLTEYIDGAQVYSAAQTIDPANILFVECFGNSTYASNAACSWNAIRVYGKALTADEISANRQLDVANYGSVNIAGA